MRIIAVVCARMGSTRLPGKSMAKLQGKPVIGHVLDRADEADLVDEVVLATTWHPEDEVLHAYADDQGYRSMAGHPNDVLRRVRDAAEWAEADIVVRLTGDCPMLDPDVIDRVIGGLTDSYDFSSNILHRTYPKGFDTEVMHLDTLQRIDRLATSPEAREHVTWFAYAERPDLFILRSIVQDQDQSAINLCVDTAEDLERLQTTSGVGFPD